MQFFCRACFLKIPEALLSVTLYHENLKRQVIFCIPEMDLRTLQGDAKLCMQCTDALGIIHKFKMKCREVENRINQRQFNATQNNRLDNTIHTVCRTCLEYVKDDNFYLAEKPLYKSKLMFCVPEMDLRVMLDINLCDSCHTILDKIYVFKMKCLDVEKSIKQYLKLHNKVDFKDLSVWCNAFIKYEVSAVEDYSIKQEEIDLINEDELSEEVAGQITNATLKDPKICQCTEKASSYRNCKCISDNVENSPDDKSKNSSNRSNCGFNTVQKDNLLEHIDTQHISTEKKSHLKKHTLTHTGKKSFKCSLCKYSTAGKSNLILHIRTHTGEKPFKCALCKYSAVSKGNLKLHIRIHTGEKPFKCLLCEFSTTNKGNLRYHMLRHTGEKPFKCSLCEYSAGNKSNLKRHILTHTSQKSLKCSLCDYSTVSTRNLKMHIYKHTNEKLFQCLLCKYSTVYKNTLRRHIRTHTGEKQFKCALCKYSAAEKFYLRNHMRTHTGEKPFKCSMCQYSTAEKSYLKIHIRTHTGEKPFKCSLCDYSVTTKSTLNRHMRKHNVKKKIFKEMSV